MAESLGVFVMSGYFEIGIYNGKTKINIGTLWRSAYQLGANGIFIIGARYRREASDTVNAMMQIPLRHYETFEDFKKNRPEGASLVGIEMGGRPLSVFCHPKTAIYLLGAEDDGLPQEILDYCNSVISLEAKNTLSYNVAIAGSIVMYHRVYLSKFNNASALPEA
jgi:tRNA G18 (ribose-2'-O)-methylase SpoU